jgi:hypothetical protein
MSSVWINYDNYGVLGINSRCLEKWCVYNHHDPGTPSGFCMCSRITCTVWKQIFHTFCSPHSCLLWIKSNDVNFEIHCWKKYIGFKCPLVKNGYDKAIVNVNDCRDDKKMNKIVYCCGTRLCHRCQLLVHRMRGELTWMWYCEHSREAGQVASALIIYCTIHSCK